MMSVYSLKHAETELVSILAPTTAHVHKVHNVHQTIIEQIAFVHLA